MWSHGRHFRVERIDHKRATFDCGVRAKFLQESRGSARDENTRMGLLDYVGTIQDILKISFRRFDMFIFDVKWFKVVTNGPNATVRRDKSGLIQVDSTKFWTDQRDSFVCPDHVEQVVFKADPKDPKWLFVVQVAPRSKQVCEGLDVEDEQPQQALDHEVGHHEADGVVQEDHVDEDVEVQVPEQFIEDTAVLDLEEEDTGYAMTYFDDEDADTHLEIDAFGTVDLEEDDRLEADL